MFERLQKYAIKIFEFALIVFICLIFFKLGLSKSTFTQIRVAGLISIICLVLHKDNIFKQHWRILIAIITFSTYISIKPEIYGSYSNLGLKIISLILAGYTAKKYTPQALSYALMVFPLTLSLNFLYKYFFTDSFYQLYLFDQKRLMLQTGNPNALGRQLMIGISYFILLEQKFKPVIKYILGIFASICFIMLLMTGCRIAIFSIIILIAYKLIFYFNRHISYILIFSLICAIITVYISNSNIDYKRFITTIKSESDISAKTRKLLCKIAFDTINEVKPIYGIKNFSDNIIQYIDKHKEYIESRYDILIIDDVKSQSNCHNTYLSIFLYYGFIGVIMIISIIILIIPYIKNTDFFFIKGTLLILAIYCIAEDLCAIQHAFSIYVCMPLGMTIANKETNTVLENSPS